MRACNQTLTPLCSSSVIEDVSHHCETEALFAFAYFFFDGRDSQKELQLHENLIRSLIRQFSAQCDGVPNPLSRLYESCGSGGWQPSINSLHATLRLILNEFQDVYIILDSLDECKERETLLTWIKEIVDWRKHKLHLLATSRDEADIRGHLALLGPIHVGMERELVDHDIQKYIHHKLRMDPNLNQWDKMVQNKINDKLMTGAEGMYSPFT